MTLWHRLKTWLKAPEFEGDEEKTRTASVVNFVLIALLIFVLISGPGFALQTRRFPFLTVSLWLGILFLRYLAVHRGHVFGVGWIITFVIWLLLGALGIVFIGTSGTFFLGLLIADIIAYVLLGKWWGVYYIGASILLSLLVVYLENTGRLVNPQSLPPYLNILGSVTFILVGSVLLFLQSSGLQGALERARFNAARFEEQNIALEQVVRERTAVLEKRARYLEVTADIARETAGMLGNPAQLHSLLVRLISRRLGLYHTGLFLLDLTGEWAVLSAASSEGGQNMLLRNHRLRVGQQGIVGYVVANHKYRIALDVGEDAVFFNNEDLPDTRSEIALPLLVRDELIGVLDVQSTQTAAFDDESVNALQTLADQVAVALNSSRMYRQQQEALAVERQMTTQLSQNAWRTLLQTERNLAYISTGEGTERATPVWRPEMLRALQHDEMVVENGEMPGGSSVAVPIRVRDKIVGVVGGRKSDRALSWSDDDLELLQALVEQLELSLEGARLYRDAQKFASMEQTVGHISGNIRESLDVDTILHVAAVEIRKAMGLERIVVRLGTPPDERTSI
ncbi:MAG: GAF domain-containing protein [Anaerolineae bacterium]|nr:GAF domain-containing protein [Anaerolineae bacterium]